MKKLTTLAAGISGVAVAAVVGLPAVAQAAAGPSAQDKQWMMANAQTDIAEIAAGKLAAAKAGTPANRRLGTELSTDHAKVLAQLKTLAGKLDVTLPTAPNAMQQAQAKQMMAADASAFDATFDRIQIAGHKLSISQTQTEISSGSDAAVVAFAKSYLPAAQMHLTHAEAALASLPQVAAVPGGAANTGGGSTAGVQDVPLLVGGLVALAGAGVLGGYSYRIARRPVR